LRTFRGALRVAATTPTYNSVNPRRRYNNHEVQFGEPQRSLPPTIGTSWRTPGPGSLPQPQGNIRRTPGVATTTRGTIQGAPGVATTTNRYNLENNRGRFHHPKAQFEERQGSLPQPQGTIRRTPWVAITSREVQFGEPQVSLPQPRDTIRGTPGVLSQPRGTI
jgi:hypothetical protein